MVRTVAIASVQALVVGLAMLIAWGIDGLATLGSNMVAAACGLGLN